MAITTLRPTSPGLVNVVRHELFKGRKQIFYVFVVAGPLFVILLITLVQAVIKLLVKDTPSTPVVALNTLTPYDLGIKGAFTVANSVVFMNIATFYAFVVVVACSLSVANEYRFSTI